ncbi:MAG: hypothetical protein ACODAG_04290 [Myxococcota bacterium]
MTAVWVAGLVALVVDVWRSRRWPVVTIALAVLLVAGALVVPAVRAEQPPRPPDQLALAKVCASEASIQTETDDCAAIAQVLRRRARGSSLGAMARAYSSRVFDRSRGDGRRWIAHLGPTGVQPEGWPERLPWASTWRARWMALYRHAGAILRGEVPSPCERPPDHWGGDMDDWRARKAGWFPVDCGQTLNHFWAVRPGGRS